VTRDVRGAWGTALAGLAGLAIGSAFVVMVNLSVFDGGGFTGGPVFTVVDLVVGITVLVALAVALVPWLARFGLVVAAAGLAGMAGLYLQGDLLPAEALYPAVGVALGLLLGGAVLALRTADRGAHWALALGLGAGLGPLGGLVLGEFTLLLQQLPGGRADELAFWLLALIALVAGLLALRRPVAPEPGRAVGAIVIVVGAVLAARLLALGWRLVLNDLAASSTGGISEDRAAFLGALDQSVRIGIAALVAVILLVGAYRRGGPELARWVVVGFAVTLPLLANGSAFFADPRLIAGLPGLAGALLGGLVALRRGPVLPWDAIGLGITVIGALLPPGLGEVGLAVVVFGLGFTITEGLVRLGGGLEVLFGLAAMVLAMQLTRPVRVSPAGPDLDVLLPVAAAAVVLGLLFLLGRRPRPSVPSVPPAPPAPPVPPAPPGPEGPERPERPGRPKETAPTAAPVTIDQG
jgi:hypothetical protein